MTVQERERKGVGAGETVAPRARRRWPLWRIVLVYGVLLAAAVASIWYVDRAAQREFSDEAAKVK